MKKIKIIILFMMLALILAGCSEKPEERIEKYKNEELSLIKENIIPYEETQYETIEKEGKRETKEEKIYFVKYIVEMKNNTSKRVNVNDIEFTFKKPLGKVIDQGSYDNATTTVLEKDETIIVEKTIQLKRKKQKFNIEIKADIEKTNKEKTNYPVEQVKLVEKENQVYNIEGKVNLHSTNGKETELNVVLYNKEEKPLAILKDYYFGYKENNVPIGIQNIFEGFKEKDVKKIRTTLIAIENPLEEMSSKELNEHFYGEEEVKEESKTKKEDIKNEGGNK